MMVESSIYLPGTTCDENITAFQRVRHYEDVLKFESFKTLHSHMVPTGRSEGIGGPTFLLFTISKSSASLTSTNTVKAGLTLIYCLSS